MYTVYKHTSPSGKCYIGITCMSPKRRWRRGKGYKDNIYFSNAINKYGWDNIKHEILFTGLTKEQAEQKEIELIVFYKSNEREYGYNIDNGGNSKGKHCKETIEKCRQANLGKHFSDEWINNNRLSQTGKPVICVETGIVYPYIKVASKETGIYHGNIIKCCKGIHKTAGGYHWRYQIGGV